MGGLAHYLEDEELPTTHISLIREHTETMQPPRALWVPFELGRPFGVPNDAAWQTRVLRAVLELLEAPGGPVLADFPDDTPAMSDGPEALVCPVSFPVPVSDLTDTERLDDTFQQEIRELRSWYDLGVTKNGRTTVGASGLDPEAIGAFVGTFLHGDIPDSPRDDIPELPLFKLVVEDLKAYYLEAIAAQPGQQTADSRTLANWFWQDTTAGTVLFTLQERWKESDDKRLQLFSQLLLVPRAQRDHSPYYSANA